MAREERVKGAMAWVALPAAILLHSITAWIFGLQISRGFWYSSIMAPMFIASALVSGLGLVILLALVAPAPAAGSRSPTTWWRCWAACLACSSPSRRSSSWPSTSRPPTRAPPRARPRRRMLIGPVPAAVPVRGRRRPGRAVPDPGDPAAAPRPARWVAVASAIAHRRHLRPPPEPGPQRPVVPQHRAAAGPPHRRAAGGLSSFAKSYWYVPTAIEWLVVTGRPRLRGAAVHARGALPADAGARGALTRGLGRRLPDRAGRRRPPPGRSGRRHGYGSGRQARPRSSDSPNSRPPRATNATLTSTGSCFVISVVGRSANTRCSSPALSAGE